MKKIILSFITSGCVLASYAQTNDELYAQGLKYRAEHNNKGGFDVFCKLMKADSTNINYITNGSYFYSKYGYVVSGSDKDKMVYYKKAEYLAKKAIQMDEKNAEAHYVYCLALGRINENASSSDKIRNAKLIKTEIDRALALNPKHAGAYHVLGRWNRTIAEFNTIEKTMINTFYGGVPTGASFENAVTAFTNAVTNEPKYILHYYELAYTLHEMGKDDYAKKFLETALTLPATDEDNSAAKKKCEELLTKIKG
jgi:tetratricopeptide (TPR) repeat protein